MSSAEYHREYYKKNKEKRLQQIKKYNNSQKGILTRKKSQSIWNKTEIGKLSSQKKSLKYIENNLIKKNAHNIIHNDKIKNPNKYKNYCEVCGDFKNINQHHEDYNKPFEVIALCKICHIKIHKLELMI